MFAATYTIGSSNLVGMCRQLIEVAIPRADRWERFLERKSISKELPTSSRGLSHQFQPHFLKSPLGFSAKLRPSASPTTIIGQCQYLVTDIYHDGSRFLFTLQWPDVLQISVCFFGTNHFSRDENIIKSVYLICSSHCWHDKLNSNANKSRKKQMNAIKKKLFLKTIIIPRYGIRIYLQNNSFSIIIYFEACLLDRFWIMFFT